MMHLIELCTWVSAFATAYLVAEGVYYIYRRNRAAKVVAERLGRVRAVRP